MTRNSNSYFFVVQQAEPDTQATIYAAGAGLDKVEAMSRLSLLREHAGTVPNVAREGIGLLNSFVSYNGSSLTEGGFSFKMDADAASVLTKTPRSMWSGSLNHAILESVQAGHRSPQSVLEQRQQFSADANALIGTKWYDESGRRIYSSQEPAGQYRETSENILLLNVKRNDSEAVISAETKDALYGALPNKRLKVRKNEVRPLRTYRKDGSSYVNGNVGVGTDGQAIHHTTFGYVKGSVFVPVVSEYASNHPLRKKTKQPYPERPS